MDLNELLGPALVDAARAIGLVDGLVDAPGLDKSWFGDPLGQIETILSNPAQRAALFDLLDRILPPAAVPGAPATARWHPLLGARSQGNLFLTVDSTATAATTVVGVGGRFAGTDGGSPSILVDVPLWSFAGTSVATIAGSAAAPLTLSLTVPIGWTPPAHSITLAAVAVTLTVAPAASPVAVGGHLTLHGFDLDGSGPADTVLDPARLGTEGARLLLGLIREKLRTASGEAAAAVSHLVPLLGLDGSVPAFPFGSIAQDPHALGAWLRALVTGTPAPIGAWLGHLAGLLGAAAPAASAATGGPGGAGSAGGGIAAQSWSVPLLAPNAAVGVSLILATATAADGVTPRLDLGIEIGLRPSAAAPVRLDLAATVLSLPLAGSGGPSGFTSVSATVSAPADASRPLLAAAAGAKISVDSLHAGLAWNGSAVVPQLEMRNVVLAGIGSFPVIDLGNARTVAGHAAADALAAAVRAALAGTPVGQHLAALAGLVAPADDPAAPLVDLAQLATHPTRTIAALHRAALLSAAHPWKIYFDEIAALLALPAATTGQGTAAEPWTATLAVSGKAALQLVACNARDSSNAAAVQRLRLGLRLAAAGPPIGGALTIDLLGFDLAANGTTTVALAGGFAASVDVVPPGPVAAGGLTIGAASLAAAVRLEFGGAPEVSATLSGLSIATPAGTLHIPRITYPFPAGFDVSNPGAALGIGVADLERLAQALLARALGMACGRAGTALAVLLGCGTGGAAGLTADFPGAADPGAPGSLFRDPLGALRAWLGRMAGGLSADGSAWMEQLVVWLGGLLASSPDNPFAAPDPYGISGSGRYDDPWQLPLGAGGAGAALVLWLDPDGPPRSAAAMAAALSGIDNPWTLAVA